MRHLMLLRHAKTERDSPTGLDRDRQLSAVGVADSPMIGRYIESHGLVPDFALVSPAVRARETWELVAAQWATKPAFEFVPDLYGAETTQLLQIVRTADAMAGKIAAQRVMVVAHNPGLHEFALALTVNNPSDDSYELTNNLPTGGLALIDLPMKEWDQLSFGSGRLERLVRPATLRQK